jgi:hypothetical protein
VNLAPLSRTVKDATMPEPLPHCVMCRVTIEVGQNVVFRSDGRVQHAGCPEVRCPVCARAIRPTDPIRRDGELLVHGNCWMRLARAAGRQDGERAENVTRLRQRIVDKLQAGVLADRRPEKLGSGFGGGRACDACDDPVLPAQTEYTYGSPSGRVLRLHVGCAGLWQAELLRRGLVRPQ